MLESAQKEHVGPFSMMMIPELDGVYNVYSPLRLRSVIPL